MEKMTQNVFLVDDDQFLLDMYAIKMRENGLCVETYTSGEDVIKRLQSGLIPHAIIMDIVMPGMDGFALLKAMNELKLQPAPAKIVLSNQGQESDIERAEELGADGYIVKASAVPSEVVAKCVAIMTGHTAKI